MQRRDPVRTLDRGLAGGRGKIGLLASDRRLRARGKRCGADDGK
jgi:hypothetical protein